MTGKRVDALYALDTCRASAWKRERSYGPQTPRKRRTNGNGRSGLQVSYRRMLDVLEDELVSQGWGYTARIKAKAIVRGALSDKQRARLDAREDR